ncbi:MAG: peptide deformylase [Bacteroidota bacterium]
MNKLSSILLLGDDRLRQICEAVKETELTQLSSTVAQMFELIKAFRNTYGFGRAIAAPQVGCLKRFVVHRPYEDERWKVYYNPVITDKSQEMMELWDNCMSFPNLYVKLRRHTNIQLTYRDASWNLQEEWLTGDDAELLQHELDHLDGILSVDHARNGLDFKWVN